MSSNTLRRLNRSDFMALIGSRIHVFDGAMGTQIQNKNLSAQDFGGEHYDGCNEHLVLTRPDVIADIHNSYLQAGADIIETNTFGATPLVLDEYQLGNQAHAINKAAAEIARRCCAQHSDSKPRYVAGSMGPTTKSLSVTGGTTFLDLCQHYHVQAKGLLDGGADLLLLETGQDTLNIKAGLVGIWRAFADFGYSRTDVPICISGTIENMGTTLAGQTAEALFVSLQHANIASIGLNCATGPDAMRDHIRALSGMADCAVSCMPNAGLPDENGHYHESPDGLARKMASFCEQGLVNIIGGCCGTSPEHIRKLAEMASTFLARPIQIKTRAYVSGLEAFDVRDTHPVIVGERTNVIGSKLFKTLISDNQFEEAAEIGRKQVRGGAHILDVCLANPDRDEKTDVTQFLKALSRRAHAPLMIDSTDKSVIEAALQSTQGKCIINSINLEDGEERFEAICPLIHQYGAAVIVGCIDEDAKQGMAITRQRKLDIAGRSQDLLTNKYGLAAHDIIFDPLVFPCATGDINTMGTARETIEGVRLIKERFPACFTVLGISNVSFGLPPAGREVLNTVFLHKCIEAGLDMAIVNSEKLERITHIKPEEIALCEALIDTNVSNFQEVLDRFVSHFRQRATAQSEIVNRDTMSVEERLKSAIVEGTKTWVQSDLDEALKTYAPLELINGPLMAGMAVVGELFGNNQLIVAEVLQSAEVMKAAVSYLENFMEKSEQSVRGKMVLATVKGDVHDIGKNLVDIILSNNGYQIINLGIKIPPQVLIAAIREHKPDLIGLSGLLVKSAQEMAITAQALRDESISLPMLVGGAALSEKFTYTRIAPNYGGLVCYARDAMSGLELANRALNPLLRAGLDAQVLQKRELLQANEQAKQVVPEQAMDIVIEHRVPKPAPPDTQFHALHSISLDTIWPYINPSMLYSRHLGLKGKLEDLLAQNDPKAIKLHESVRAVESWVLEKNLLNCHALYQFFRAESDGDRLKLFGDMGELRAQIDFPRQTQKERRCIADLVAPSGSSINDYVGLFVTSCQGSEKMLIRTLAEELKQQGEYLKSHILLALAIETAEGAAEWLHQKMRAMWGIPDSGELTKKDLFQAHYRGRRYSFGYPACPNLEDQAILWKLLSPDVHIGVELTEGFMMDPESSVSALVFAHPDATYFSVLS